MNKLHEENKKSGNVPLDFDGNTIFANIGEPVAAAILSAHPDYTGTSAVKGRRRSPYCLMGACFECLMEINGVPNQRACMIPVRENMSVRRQIGTRALLAKEPGK